MGGALPPFFNPAAGGVAPPLDPPLYFEPGTHARLSIVVDPSLI